MVGIKSNTLFLLFLCSDMFCLYTSLLLLLDRERERVHYFLLKILFARLKSFPGQDMWSV